MSNASIAKSFGRFVGQTGAYVYEGSRLGATQFAAGVQEGYAEKAAQLRAARLAALDGAVPVPVVQAAKARVRTAKAA